MTTLARGRRTALDTVRVRVVGQPPTDPATGHGRMWHEVLRRLPTVPGIAFAGRAPWSRADVLLADGHAPVPAGRTPLVAQVHEASWRDAALRSLLNPVFAEHLDRTVAATVERATLLLTGAESARREIIDAYGVDPERVRVVPHGVDLDVFNPAPPDGGTSAPPTDAPYVLFVGTVHPRKNLPVLREAMEQLAADGLPHHLVLVLSPAADRPDSSDLWAAAAAPLRGAPGRVHVYRGLDDRALAALMRGAAALCLPSESEGFGLPALEAMACGTPAVVADRGSLPEVVADGGVAVEPDAGAIAAGLARVIGDDATAAAARRRAEQFGWDRTAAKWAAAVRDAAEGGRS